VRAKDTSRPRALPLGPRMLPLPMATTVVPEWDAARAAVRDSYAREGALRAALRACLDLEIYKSTRRHRRRSAALAARSASRWSPLASHTGLTRLSPSVRPPTPTTNSRVASRLTQVIRSQTHLAPAPTRTCTDSGATRGKPTLASPQTTAQAEEDVAPMADIQGVDAKEQAALPVTEGDDAEEQLAALRRLGVPIDALPALNGDTPIHLRQAEEIRSTMLANIVDEYKSFREGLDEQQGDGAIDRQEAVRQRQWRHCCVIAVVRQVDARWWLDRQEYEGWRLVRVMARQFR